MRASYPAENLEILRGHTDEVNLLAFSRNGRWLSTGSLDGSALLWDLKAATPPANPLVLRKSDAYIGALAFSFSDRWLATAGGDKTIWLWDLTSNDPSANPGELTGSEKPVTALAFSPGTPPAANGRWLASGGQDGSVGGQCYRRQGLAFHLEAPDDFGGKVLGIGRISANRNLERANEARARHAREHVAQDGRRPLRVLEAAQSASRRHRVPGHTPRRRCVLERDGAAATFSVRAWRSSPRLDQARSIQHARRNPDGATGSIGLTGTGSVRADRAIDLDGSR